ncbi:MAG TPA: CHAD domain-containing protein [Caulobacterales bacterium]|nr:CHAD domain-containing protein [Caulobacterales bacterium]
MSRTQERELKFEFESGEAVEALVDAASAGAPARVQLLETIYFDTPDFDLREGGLSLRVRRAGDQYVQTIKRYVRAGGGTDRWEQAHEVAGPVPQFDEADAKMLSRVSVIAEKAVLRPVFTVRSERTSWQRSAEGVDVEFALDRGEIVAGGNTTSLCELEIELKQGAPRDLFDVARVLSESARLRPTAFTKDERGYRLLDESWGKPARAKPAPLTPRMTPRTAFRAIAHSCVQHFMLNEEVVRLRFDGEAIHQARIGIRRLRSALSLFAPLVQDTQTALVKADLKWISDSLGKVRDLDVFEVRILGARAPDDAPLGFRDLSDHIADLKRQRYGDLVRDLSSERWRRALLRLLQWIEAGDWALRDEVAETAMAFATRRVTQKWQKLSRAGSVVRKLDDEALHDLRKCGKRLRYATEFFAPLVKGAQGRERAKDFIGALEDLQNALGRQHDLVFAADMLTEMAAAASAAKPTLMFAAGHLAGEMRSKLAVRSMAGAQAAARKITATAPF